MGNICDWMRRGRVHPGGNTDRAMITGPAQDVMETSAELQDKAFDKGWKRGYRAKEKELEIEEKMKSKREDKEEKNTPRPRNKTKPKYVSKYDLDCRQRHYSL